MGLDFSLYIVTRRTTCMPQDSKLQTLLQQIWVQLIETEVFAASNCLAMRPKCRPRGLFVIHVESGCWKRGSWGPRVQPCHSTAADQPPGWPTNGLLVPDRVWHFIPQETENYANVCREALVMDPQEPNISILPP